MIHIVCSRRMRCCINIRTPVHIVRPSIYVTEHRASATQVLYRLSLGTMSMIDVMMLSIPAN